ncbi:MAG: hypothetical protein V1806_03815 [Pseudomonadota bacterium]
MLITTQPQPGRDFAPGWVGFSCALDSALASAIALRTAGREWLHGRLVATHVGTVITDDAGNLVVAEALGGGYQLTPIEAWIDADGRSYARWFQRPCGLTLKAAEFMAINARLWAAEHDGKGRGYDFEAILLGFPTASDQHLAQGRRLWAEDPERVFCSEAAAALLKASVELLDPAPPVHFMAADPSSWSPQALRLCPGLWG